MMKKAETTNNKTQSDEDRNNSGTTMNPNKSGQMCKNILVVGDWLVDEHWAAGVHRSATGSRTGQAHYRVLHEIDSIVQSFCGAGTPASLLYHTYKQNERCFSVYGMGLWHKEDTAIMQDMFDYERLKKGNMFKLSHSSDIKLGPENVKLINLVEAFPDDKKKEISTTRIIRIYHSINPDEFKFFRMDWELRPRELTDTEVISAFNKKLFPGMETTPDKKVDIDAIVIKDLVKGVISRPLIRKLVELYKGARWFVSSKAWLPDWFEELQNVDLRLLMIPQIAAQRAVRDGIVNNWITRSGYPGEMVFSCVEEIFQKIGKNHENIKIIILPKGYSAIALVNPKIKDVNEPNCIIQKVVNPQPSILPMGMASIFLPAVVGYHFLYEDQEQEKKEGQIQLRNMLEKSLKLTYRWGKIEAQRLQNPGNWGPEKNFFVETFKPSDDSHYTFKSINWEMEEKIWKQATKGIGVINVEIKNQNIMGKEKTKKYFELWRSMIEVDGYVCTMEAKRKEIRKIINGISHFLRGEKKHHTGCLLAANPGSGKTTLVKRLAQSVNLRFLPFNITQMSSRADLQDCFDTIVTTQAQDRNQPILVFIDEVNAKLDNSYVYDAFLAPLEEGIYVKGGKAFHIDPCIWIFAGTEDPSAGDNLPSTKSDKKSDFVSRLELGIIDLRKQEDVHRRQLEFIYMGVALLINEYPDVRHIYEKVLKAFEDLPPNVCVRDIKHFIKAFDNIQYGEVHPKNVPVDKLKEIKGFDFKKWYDKDDGVRVEISDIPSRDEIKKIVDY